MFLLIENSDQSKDIAAPVSLDEIRANKYNLNIARYVDVTEKEQGYKIELE